MAEETECLEIVELIKRHIKTAHDPNVSVLYKQMPHKFGYSATCPHTMPYIGAALYNGMWAGS